MKFLCVLCVLVFPAYALDRGAFTFTNYDLNVRVEPEQQRLAVRGKIRLRNDSGVPQKNLVLQLSSTLAWESIQFGGKTAQFVTHEYTSDIDHTGALSEAVVSLPQEISSKDTVELDIGYEGVIPLETTRLTRIGVTEEKARHIEWDRISKSFTAVRGIGYVAWYPVATEAVNLSEGSSVEHVVARWKARQTNASMSIRFESTSSQAIFFSGDPSQEKDTESPASNRAAFRLPSQGIDVPTFVIADYQKLMPNDVLTICYLPGQEESAKDFGEVAAHLDPVVPAGGESGNLRILGLPDQDSASFVTRDMLLTSLKPELTNEAELSIVYAKARQAVPSPRAWIQEGLAHYAQAAFIEKQQGRQAAVSYLDAHASALIENEKAVAGKLDGGESVGSLIDAQDGLYLQTKAMYVWWMLKDMVGNMLVEALTSHRASEDKDPAYLQRLIEKTTHRDLRWFFDDWVYHDLGLPDFLVDSVFSRRLDTGGFLVTVTVENLGKAGAEVPVILKIEGGEIRRQLEVRGRSKASVRIEAAVAPLEVVVNDGSVPEGDRSNNTYKIHLQDATK